MGTTDDLTTILREQHRQITVKLHAVAASSGAERDAVFDDLRRFLAVHQAAEDVWVHAAARGAPSRHSAAPRTAETPETAGLMTELEGLGIDSVEFSELFRTLTVALTAHAEATEQQELPLIIANATGAQTQLMLGALQSVPTIAAGDGYSATTSASFTFAGALRAATVEFQSMQQDEELTF